MLKVIEGFVEIDGGGGGFRVAQLQDNSISAIALLWMARTAGWTAGEGYLRTRIAEMPHIVVLCAIDSVWDR
jgi:hypothetical protein